MLLIETYVGMSKIEGLGLFAAKDIPAGTKIWDFHSGYDQVLDENQLASMPEWQSAFFRKYCFSNDGKYYYCIDDARFMNHSDSPNAMDKEDGTYAAKHIKAGHEITCNYAGMGKHDKDHRFNMAWYVSK
ncbi:MAG: SET domain-containing protein-lysine N-methyltransferase [Erysipelotrichia bacterium]|nr:SET domain-containing protein [Candidatus Riflebacteria bacterium]NCB39318.1 SET domain-containing protein-lysine N-methyltransferase [Erysipelotrichia bacterium]